MTRFTGRRRWRSAERPVYTPPANYNGATNLTITTNDRASTATIRAIAAPAPPSRTRTSRSSTSPTLTTRRPSRRRHPAAATILEDQPFTNLAAPDRHDPVRRPAPPTRSTTRTEAAPTRPARSADTLAGIAPRGIYCRSRTAAPRPAPSPRASDCSGCAWRRVAPDFRSVTRSGTGRDRSVRAREDDRALQRISAPARCREPLVLLKRLDRPGLEPLHGFLAHRRDAVEEVLRQHRDVVTPLPQRP